MSTLEPSRAARLIRIIAEVKTNPRQTVEDLLKKFAISKTQFYEDRQEIIRGLGFEFSYSRPKGMFEITNDPYIPIPDLKLGELLSLVMAVRQLSAAGDYILTYDALQGVRKLIRESRLEIAQKESLMTSTDDVVLRQGFGCDPRILEELQQAVVEHRRCKIENDSPEEGFKWWTIDPYQIFFKKRALYLDAYCLEAKDIRTFRINRIKKIKDTGIRLREPVDKRYSFATRHRSSFGVFTGGEVQTVRIRFNRRLAPYIRETLWHYSQKITPLSEDGILFEVEVCEPKEVCWWVMQYGAEAEILEPSEIRTMAAQMAREMVELYEGKRS
ncbi:MAG: WYL domain-containing protein [Candidatus Latescibacteria bacterium]|nr:WYL domain-containing protein [Candidatus Latescibacterota bacterium]